MPGCQTIQWALPAAGALGYLVGFSQKDGVKPTGVKPVYTVDEGLRLEGIRAYQQFEYVRATELFARYLQNGNSASQNRCDAHAYLAASFFMLGDAARARSEFVQIRRHDRNYRLDADVFQPAIVEMYESISPY